MTIREHPKSPTRVEDMPHEERKPLYGFTTEPPHDLSACLAEVVPAMRQYMRAYAVAPPTAETAHDHYPDA